MELTEQEKAVILKMRKDAENRKKRFPLILDSDNWIPWEVAEEIYKEYSHQFGTSQSLQRLEERGGFGKIEAIKLLYERVIRLEKKLRSRKM